MATPGARAILGIDPGSRATGYGLVMARGRALAVAESGTIRLPAGEDVAVRLGELARRLAGLVERLRPALVAVEDIFTHKNARSALLLGQARGAVLAEVGRRGIEVAAYPPATVKQAVVGHGRATKAQVQRMVQVLLSLDAPPASDEADALAVAICCAMDRRRQAAGGGAP